MRLRRTRSTRTDRLFPYTTLFRSPPQAIQGWLRVIGKQMPISKIRASDEYDIVLDYRRAETGEIETGKLLYAGLIRGGKPKLSMLEWTKGGRAQWFEVSGVGERSEERRVGRECVSTCSTRCRRDP